MKGLAVQSDSAASAPLEGRGKSVLVSNTSSLNASSSIIDLAEKAPASGQESSDAGSGVLYMASLQMDAHSFLAPTGLGMLFVAGLLVRTCANVMPVSQTRVRYAQLDTPQQVGLGKTRSPVECRDGMELVQGKCRQLCDFGILLAHECFQRQPAKR